MKKLKEQHKHECPGCSYGTSRKNNLNRHVSTMHEPCEKDLTCCSIKFLNKASFKKHTNEKHKDGFDCLVCHKKFNRKALLIRHQSIHSGHKEFHCHICSYATSHKSNLERHLKVHSIDKNKTDKCAKNSSRNQSKRHDFTSIENLIKKDDSKNIQNFDKGIRLIAGPPVPVCKSLSPIGPLESLSNFLPSNNNSVVAPFPLYPSSSMSHFAGFCSYRPQFPELHRISPMFNPVTQKAMNVLCRPQIF